MTISLEQAEKMLFEEEETKTEEEPERLLKKMVPQDEGELKTIPYYKKPLVQIIAVIAFLVPILWGIVSAFSPPKPSANSQGKESTEDKQEQLYKESLEEERRKNQELALKTAMKSQELEVIPVKQLSTTPTTPTTNPTQKPVVQQPVPSRPQTVVRQTPVQVQQQPQPIIKPVAIAPRVVRLRHTPQRHLAHAKEPLPDPMELWLAQANNGLYLAPKGEGTYVSYSQPSNANVEVSVEEEIPTAIPLEREASRTTLEEKTNIPSTSQPSEDVAQNDFTDNSTLDIGSQGVAKLHNGIAWTEAGPSNNQKYLLTLTQPFKNTQGKEILPSGTRLIAEISNTSQAGIFFMEVTRILTEGGAQTISPGAMQIVAHNGSPLKAELRKLDDNSFWQDFSAVVARGFEGAMGALADSSESLILEGSRSVISSTNGGSNPLAAGIGGLASGVSQVLGNRMENGNEVRPVPYFWFPSGETVQIIVYDDISL